MKRRQFLGIAAGTIPALLGATRPVLARSAGSARVVVVGGGFAGATFARYLRLFSGQASVTLVDPEARYVTCPMSNAVIAGLRDMASISWGREGLRTSGVRWLQDSVAAIDAERQTVRLSGGSALAYDRLVFAPGIRFLWGTPEGYDEDVSELLPHAWKAGSQTARLAAQLRDMHDGGIVAISVPLAPFRCPPGPYERASLIAHYLKHHKPRSKVLIFDANNKFSKQGLFLEAWSALYPGMIEWLPLSPVLGIDAQQRRLRTAAGEQTVAVANIIPPQAPALLARQAGLSESNGWCPVNAQTFESLHVRGIHVLGDACLAEPMPKSATSANSQAKQCAWAMRSLLRGEEPGAPSLANTCYSLVAPDYGISINATYRVATGKITAVEGAGGVSPPEAPPIFRQREARHAREWYRSIVADSFGVV